MISSLLHALEKGRKDLQLSAWHAHLPGRGLQSRARTIVYAHGICDERENGSFDDMIERGMFVVCSDCFE